MPQRHSKQGDNQADTRTRLPDTQLPPHNGAEARLRAVTADDTLEGVQHTKLNDDIGQRCLKGPRFIKRVRHVQRRTRSIKIASVSGGGRLPARGAGRHAREHLGPRGLRHHVRSRPVFREVIPESTGRGGTRAVRGQCRQADGAPCPAACRLW